jgi:hypothetical protein
MKSWESNCQFDSRPLKVKNLPDSFACRCCATYRWKYLNTGYTFASDFISIKGFHTKLWISKVARVPILGMSGLPFGSPGTKWHLGASPMARHIVYYKGENDGFSQVRVVMSLVNMCLAMVRPGTKNAPTVH